MRVAWVIVIIILGLILLGGLMGYGAHLDYQGEEKRVAEKLQAKEWEVKAEWSERFEDLEARLKALEEAKGHQTKGGRDEGAGRSAGG